MLQTIGTVAVTLGVLLSNCGNPSGHPDKINAVNASCTGYALSWDGFGTSDNIRITQTVQAKVDGGEWFVLYTTSDDTLLQDAASRSHYNVWQLGGGGGGGRTVMVRLNWTDTHGAAQQTYTGNFNC